MKALIGVLALVVLGALWQASASASGSISIGGGISPETRTRRQKAHLQEARMLLLPHPTGRIGPDPGHESEEQP